MLIPETLRLWLQSTDARTTMKPLADDIREVIDERDTLARAVLKLSDALRAAAIAIGEAREDLEGPGVRVET